MNLAFPNGIGWQDVRFRESPDILWTRSAVAAWINSALLNGPDPFASHGGKVPLPWTAKPAHGGKFATARDQLEPGQWVTYSRRQLCFIVAKSLLGANTAGYANGLLRFMEKRPPSGCAPETG